MSGPPKAADMQGTSPNNNVDAAEDVEEGRAGEAVRDVVDLVEVIEVEGVEKGALLRMAKGEVRTVEVRGEGEEERVFHLLPFKRLHVHLAFMCICVLDVVIMAKVYLCEIIEYINQLKVHKEINLYIWN